jgi:hypothetical protein
MWKIWRRPAPVIASALLYTFNHTNSMQLQLQLQLTAKPRPMVKASNPATKIFSLLVVHDGCLATLLRHASRRLVASQTE